MATAVDGGRIDGLLRRIGIDRVEDWLGALVLLGAKGETAAALAEALERRLGANDRLARGEDGACLVAFADDNDLGARLRCALAVEDVAGGAVGVDVATLTAGPDGVRAAPAPLAKTLEDALRAVGGGAVHKVEAGSSIADLSFVFRPVLEVRSRVVSTFQCIPIRPVTGGFASGYGVLAGDDPGAIEALDLATLDKVGEAATHRGRARWGSSLALTVHFSTLADPPRHERYVEAFTARFAQTDASLVVEVAGLPPDGDVRWFARRAADLLRGDRRLFVRCGPEGAAVEPGRAIGAHAMGIDFYDRVDDEQTIMATMDSFAAAAKRGQFRSYVLGVRSISLYTAAVACGFDYVAGHALTSVVRNVEDIQRFQPDMPYFALLDAVAGPGSACGPDARPGDDDAQHP